MRGFRSFGNISYQRDAAFASLSSSIWIHWETHLFFQHSDGEEVSENLYIMHMSDLILKS